jgi:hypothetical protein
MSDEKKYLDYEGLQYLWSKISMEDYPNNEMLVAIINAIDESKADKEYVTSITDSIKKDLSESITVESDEWKVIDKTGNIIFSVDGNGAHTTALSLNGESIEDIIDNIQITPMSDEEIDLICGSSLAIEITSGVMLKDANTEIMYKVYVEDGKLHMMEVE